jgi:hypothetical protein
VSSARSGGSRRGAVEKGQPTTRSGHRRRGTHADHVDRTPPRPGRLHRRAQETALGGLQRGDDVDDRVRVIASHYVRGVFGLDVAMLKLAYPPSGAEPLAYEGLRERYLPEVTFRRRVNQSSSQYALYAAACCAGNPVRVSTFGAWPCLGLPPGHSQPAVVARRHVELSVEVDTVQE